MKHSSIEDDPHDDSIETEIPKMYLKVQSLIEFDTFVITHGPFTSVDSGEYIYTSFILYLGIRISMRSICIPMFICLSYRLSNHIFRSFFSFLIIVCHFFSFYS